MTETSTTTRRVKSRRRPASERRRRRPPSPEHLVVTLSIPQRVQEKISREWIVRVSTRAFLMHTLHSRGVCPTLANETIRVYKEQQNGTRANPMDRKFIKFGGALHRLLEEWELLCSISEVERVLISLGPSFSRQREHHFLDFAGLEKTDLSETPK